MKWVSLFLCDWWGIGSAIKKPDFFKKLRKILYEPVKSYVMKLIPKSENTYIIKDQIELLKCLLILSVCLPLNIYNWKENSGWADWPCIHRKEGTEKHFSYLFPASSKTSWFLRGGVGQKSSATAALVEHSTWDSWKRAGKQSKAQAKTFPPLLSRACFYGVAPAETGVNLRQADGGENWVWHLSVCISIAAI